jgi:hypothetical protein
MARRVWALVVHEDMRKGLHSLAKHFIYRSMARAVCHVLTLPNSFGAVPGDRGRCLNLCAAGLSRSMLPSALGLLVGLVSLSFSKYLNTTLEAFDRELKCTSLDLVNQITRFRGRWIVGPPMKPVHTGPVSERSRWPGDPVPNSLNGDAGN